MNFVASLVVVADLLCGISFTPRTVAREVRAHRINVHVTVKDYSGSPIPDVLLAVHDGNTPVVDAATDDSGVAKFTFDLDPNVDRVDVRHSFAVGSSFDKAQQIALSKRMTALRSEYFIEERHELKIVPEQTTYSVDIELHEAINVRGVVVGDDGDPRGYMVYGPGAFQLGDASRGMQFRIKGVRKAADTTLLAVAKRVNGVTQIVPVHLTSDQTQDDIDLGRIIIPQVESDALLDVRLDNLDVVDNTRTGVTFVRADGEMAFAAYAFNRQHERGGEVSGNPIQLPEGEYYLAPGNAEILPYGEVWALIEALHAGRDLDAYDIPKITLEKDKAYSFNFDLAEVQSAIRKMMDG